MSDDQTMTWDNSPAMRAARLGTRVLLTASGHADMRHETGHRHYARLTEILDAETAAILDGHEDDLAFRCCCPAGVGCCARMDAEDFLCTACRTLGCAGE